MELFQLRYAIMLSECRNFSRAAEKLFITQPTLSQQIQRLEHEIGFPLFKREFRQITPTAAGERFLLSAAKVVQEHEKLLTEVQNIQNSLERKVVFGTSPISSPFITGTIPLFLADYPKVSLMIVEAHDPDLITMALKSELDLAIVSLPHNHPQRNLLHVIPIQEEYVCALLKKDHPLTKQPEITLEELHEQKLVFPSSSAGSYKIMSDAFKQNGMSMPETTDLVSIEARVELIMSGAVGIALSEQKAWHIQNNIVRVPIFPRINSTFAVITEKGKRITPELDDLIQIVAIRKSGQRNFP